MRPGFARAIERIQTAGAPVLALDIPSGLCADTGRVLGIAVRADVTVTFIGMKRGLVTGNGPDYTGQVVLDTLEVPRCVPSDDRRQRGAAVERPSLVAAGTQSDRVQTSVRPCVDHRRRQRHGRRGGDGRGSCVTRRRRTRQRRDATRTRHGGTGAAARNHGERRRLRRADRCARRPRDRHRGRAGTRPRRLGPRAARLRDRLGQAVGRRRGRSASADPALRNDWFAGFDSDRADAARRRSGGAAGLERAGRSTRSICRGRGACRARAERRGRIERCGFARGESASGSASVCTATPVWRAREWATC